MRPAILVVDDNEDARTMLGKLLEAYGFDVALAADGPDALKCLELRRFAIAIIDYKMPGMNGLDLFRRMRRARPELAAVFLTGYTTIDVVYPAIEAGVLHVLSKPVDFQELLPILEEHAGAAA